MQAEIAVGFSLHKKLTTVLQIIIIRFKTENFEDFWIFKNVKNYIFRNKYFEIYA
jgi:hypothetical protein